MSEKPDDQPPNPAWLVKEYERQTIGTGEWHRNFLGLIYTDGIKFVAETCEAYWLIDLVASHQPDIRKVLEQHGLRPFQVWRLHWAPDEIDQDGAVVNVKWTIDAWSDTPEYPGGDEGGPALLLAKQEIGYSTFPEALSPFEFWVEGETALLKAEH